MKQSSRLTRSEDINRVREQGKSFVHTAIVLGRLPNQLNENRIAVIAGRSVGGAVQRNLAKRRIRSAIQSFQGELKQGFDMVVIARKSILAVDYPALVDAMRKLFQQAELMKDKFN